MMKPAVPLCGRAGLSYCRPPRPLPVSPWHIWGLLNVISERGEWKGPELRRLCCINFLKSAFQTNNEQQRLQFAFSQEPSFHALSSRSHTVYFEMKTSSSFPLVIMTFYSASWPLCSGKAGRYGCKQATGAAVLFGGEMLVTVPSLHRQTAVRTVGRRCCRKSAKCIGCLQMTEQVKAWICFVF